MSLKKHPILLVLIILVIVVALLGGIMTVIQGGFGSSSSPAFAEKIGVIPIFGEIANPAPIMSQLIEFRKEKKIKAIILRVDSPGGGVGASQEIYREIRKTIPEKTVITSMGGVAASGGYYIAAAGNKIVANPGTITGSIGVIMQFYQFHELSKKIGISMEVLKSGEFKDVGSPYREVTDKERELIQSFIAEIQSQFVDAVATGRNLPPEKVREIADGRILSGARARELGLVDQLGNFQDAVDLAKEMAGIEGEVDLVYPKEEKIGLLDLLVQSTTKVLSNTLKETLKTSTDYRLSAGSL